MITLVRIVLCACGGVAAVQSAKKGDERSTAPKHSESIVASTIGSVGRFYSMLYKDQKGSWVLYSRDWPIRYRVWHTLAIDHESPLRHSGSGELPAFISPVSPVIPSESSRLLLKHTHHTIVSHSGRQHSRYDWVLAGRSYFTHSDVLFHSPLFGHAKPKIQNPQIWNLLWKCRLQEIVRCVTRDTDLRCLTRFICKEQNLLPKNQ